MIWLLPHPCPHLSCQLARPATHRKTKSDNLLMGEVVRGWGEEPKSYDGEKDWSSVNHSILCGWHLSTWTLWHCRLHYTRHIPPEIYGSICIRDNYKVYCMERRKHRLSQWTLLSRHSVAKNFKKESRIIIPKMRSIINLSDILFEKA